MHDGVVPFAEQGGVRQVGDAEVCPVDEVVTVRPLRRRITPRVGAPAVAEPHPFGLRVGEVPLLAALVQDLPVRAEHDGDDGPVAAQSAHGLGREVGAGVEAAEGGGGAEPVAQRLPVHRQHQGRLVVLAPFLTGRDRPPDEGEQGVATAPVRAAQVAFAVHRLGRRQRAEGGLEDGLALDVEGQSVLEDAGAVVVGLGQGDEPFGGVLLGLEDVGQAVPGEQGGAEHPAAARPVICRHRDQPLQDVGLGALGEQRAQPVGLGDHRGGGPHRDPPGVHRGLDRGVGGLAERLRHRDQLPGAAGAGRRRPVPHPLRGGHRRRAAGGLPAVHRLTDHRHAGGPAGGAQPVELAEQRTEVRATGPPQLGVEALQRGAGGRDLREPLVERQGPLHENNPRGDHRQPSEQLVARTALCSNAVRRILSTQEPSPVDSVRSGTRLWTDLEKPLGSRSQRPCLPAFSAPACRRSAPPPAGVSAAAG